MILGHYQLKMSLKGVERWTGEIFNSVSRFSFMLGSTLDVHDSSVKRLSMRVEPKRFLCMFPVVCVVGTTLNIC